MSERDSVRAFLALPRDRMWVESARGLLETIRPGLPDASWTREESWHVTLKFLGEVTAEVLREFAAEIAPRAAETVPGELQSDGAVVFPPRGPARVLGVGFAPNDARLEIDRLAEAAETAARRLGVAGEDREFRPHVTLARLRHPWPREKVEAFRGGARSWRFPPWHTRSCVLYESRLTPDGAVHTPVGEWSFSGGPRGVRA